MKILIAPDSFKDCLSAIDVSRALWNGIRSVKRNVKVALFPMADGGEGTTEILNYHISGRWQMPEVSDPLGRKIKSKYLLLNDAGTAVIELAKASGLELLKPEERNPLKTNTFGTGELIRHALDSDAEKIILTIGGSATVDGGTGIASALGFRFFDDENREFVPTGGNLTNIVKIDSSKVHPKLQTAHWTIASDVQNLLNGPEGAARIFGPQKGADQNAVKILEQGLEHLSKLIADKTEFVANAHAGTGAAGGAAVFLMAYANASLRPGFDILADLCGFHKAMEDASIIITGEGKLDAQTKYGKVVSSISHYALKKNIPVVVVSGITDDEPVEIKKALHLSEIFTIRNRSQNEKDSFENAKLYLEQIGAEIAQRYITA